MIDNSELMHLAFLDTSVIDPTKNNYSRLRSEFDLLKKYVDRLKVILLTHEIVLNETKNHIYKAIETVNKQLYSLQNSKELALINKNKYKSLFLTFESNEMAKDAFYEFKKNLENLKVEILKSNHISIKQILNDYFNCNPPFDTGDKKSEFPDAIMYQSLKKVITDKEKLHIISNDNDWKKICSQEPNYICHKSIKSFLDYLNKDDAYSNIIKNYLSSDEAQIYIFDRFMDIINNIQFKVRGGSFDRHGVFSGFDYDESELKDITNLGYKLDTINDISYDGDNQTANITIICYADIIMNCLYFDEENSIWDNEDHMFIDKIYGSNLERHEFIVPIEIKLSGKETEKISIDEFEIIDTDLDFSILDNQTLIERNTLNRFNNETYENFYYVKTFECPSCNKEVKVNLISGETVCVSTTERQMGIENEYEIKVEGVCEHCNNEYIISGKLWEYPVNSFNYEKDIKITKK